MGIAKKTDGRYEVGLGVTDANDYKGSLSYRDIYIQLTADGATADSVEKLTFLKDYAVYHSGLGEPIMPPSVNVWISNNGTTTAVEADDLKYEDDTFTICGITYSDGAWDYSNAGQSGGGGGGGGYTPLVIYIDNPSAGLANNKINNDAYYDSGKERAVPATYEAWDEILSNPFVQFFVIDSGGTYMCPVWYRTNYFDANEYERIAICASGYNTGGSDVIQYFKIGVQKFNF